jgi:hypothetical protein
MLICSRRQNGSTLLLQLARSFALLILLQAAVSGPALAAPIAFVQSNSATPQSPQTTVAITYTAAQTLGNLNVVVVGWNDSTATVSSVGDLRGNTYALAGVPVVQSATGSQAIYYAKNIAAAAAGANTVTVTFSVAARYPDIRIAEYSGLDTVNPLDVSTGARGTTTSISNSGPVTTTNANDLLVGANLVQSTTIGAGTGYTSRRITQDADILEDRVVTVTGSYSATAALNKVQPWIMQLVAFRAAGSGTPAPSITSLNPTSGVVGAPVTITGSNFGASQGTSTVTFNGTAATPTSWSATSITVPVPTGAITGNVVVTVGGIASNGFSFTVLPTPAITSLTPASGPVGASVTIAGTNFGATQGSSTITFSGIVATPTSWNATSIAAPVPNGAITGNVVVTVNGVASNGVSFSVTSTTPSITSLNPTSAPVGSPIIIAGTNFGASQGTSAVTFNGTSATPTAWSTTSITIPVPAGATTGNVVVTVGGVASNGVSFTVTIPGPSITTLNPTSGVVGAPVTITGSNFGASQGTSTVTFNGTAATPTSWSATSITVPVPTGAITGNVVVTVGGIASNGFSFTVLPTPAITSLTPASGPVGASVTIAGTNFGATQGSSTITFSGIVATPTSWNATSIAAPVPNGAITGNVVVTVNGVASNGVAFAVGSSAQTAVTGLWQTLPNLMPINPVHAAMMHNGTVLVVSGSGNVPNNSNLQAGIFDPVTGAVTTQPIAWDMFCDGMVILSDGRAFINSGTLQYDPFHGDVRSAAFDPATGQFVNLQNMAHGRWYPTVTTLGDGRVMTFSGLTENGATNTAVEIYTVGSGWSQQYMASWTPPLYPRMNLLPNGKVFYSGPTTPSWTFDPSTHNWTVGPSFNYSGTRTYGSSVLLPLTPANGYKPRVMILGGGNPATATTEIIDLSVPNPVWSSGPPMSQPRIEMNATILPNGKVLALGGSLNDEDTNSASLNADLYDPATNTFGSAGANSFARLYHSVSLLLPDGRVWFAGGNPQRGTYEPHMEIYSPAYLFTADGSLATRPTIAAVSSGVISYSGPFQVQTPDAANITTAVLMRAGAVTHAFDMEQRLVGLSFTAGSGVLNLTAPPNGNVAPPGYYLLFILNSSGVPSVGQFVQLLANPNAPTITSLSPAAGLVGSSVTITGSNFGVSQGTSTVTFNGTAATTTSWSATSIVVPVPAGATTGNVVVTVGGVAGNGFSFTVGPVSTTAFVQRNSATPQTPQATLSVPYTAAQTAGNLNLVVVGWNDSTATVASVTDSVGNAYALAAPPVVQSGIATQAIYYAKSILSAAANANTVKVTFTSAAIFPDIRIAEYTGIDTVSPLDQSVGAQGNSATSNSAAVTTTNANDLLIGANLVQSTTTGPGAGYTSRSITPDGDILEDQIVTATGSYAATAALDKIQPWIMQMAAFRAANSGSSKLTVTVTPKRAAVTLSQTQPFAGSVTNDPQNAGVTWSVDGNPGGNATTGTITSAGLFTPGSQPGLHSVKATSVTNSSVSATVTIAVTDLAGVFTYHNDVARTGQNLKEYALSPSTINLATFSQLFSCPVDGYVYAQPLYVANLLVGSTTHNVVFVSTEHDSVYAFDADSPTCVQLWTKSFLGSGVTTVPAVDTGENLDPNLVPETGITSTPVVDPATNTLYVVPETKETVGSGCSATSPCYFHRLHALDIVSGLEKFGGPVVASATNFNPLRQLQRPALLLANSTVYVGFGSHSDIKPYEGWLMGFDASTLVQKFAWSSTDTAGGANEGAIWQSGNGPAADASGNVYVETANGTFDGTKNFADSAVKLSPTGVVLDYFTPFDQATMQANDIDMGSSGPIILPDAAGSTSHPNLLLATGKIGILYLLDQSNLGKFNSAANQDVQEVTVSLNTTNVDHGFFGQAAYWNGALYAAAVGDSVRQFLISNGIISAPSNTNSSNTLPFRGATPVVSASGTSNGIVWIVDVTANKTGGPAILDAYDASNLANWLYSSPASGTGAAGAAAKFTVPTVANGKVYVGGQASFTVFGLLPN